jgi:hypothetical protein
LGNDENPLKCLITKELSWWLKVKRKPVLFVKAKNFPVHKEKIVVFDALAVPKKCFRGQI